MDREPIAEADRLSVRVPPPGRPIMYQSWGELLFMHWPVPAHSLRPLIPEPLAIDIYDGVAWIGITPFTTWGLRPVLLPAVPLLSESHEINVRTYVHFDGVLEYGSFTWMPTIRSPFGGTPGLSPAILHRSHEHRAAGPRYQLHIEAYAPPRAGRRVRSLLGGRR